MYTSQFRKMYTEDWFCGPWSQMCNRVNEMWDVQIHFQALFQDLAKNTGRVKTSAYMYNTGKTKSNTRASVGLWSANNIQRAREEGWYNNMTNNPNEVQTESEWRDKG